MNVIWTFKALKTYFKVSDYLQSEWGDAVVKNFANEVDRIIKEIKLNPYMLEASTKYKNVRKGFLTEHSNVLPDKTTKERYRDFNFLG